MLFLTTPFAMFTWILGGLINIPKCTLVREPKIHLCFVYGSSTQGHIRCRWIPFGVLDQFSWSRPVKACQFKKGKILTSSPFDMHRHVFVSRLSTSLQCDETLKKHFFLRDSKPHVRSSWWQAIVFRRVHGCSKFIANLADTQRQTAVHDVHMNEYDLLIVCNSNIQPF